MSDINNIDFNNEDVFDDSKYHFRNDIKLFNYQKKTIISLMEHEKGQKKISLPISQLSTIENELYDKDYTFSNNFQRDMKRFLKSNDHKFLFKNNMSLIDKFNIDANFGYNIGVLSNSVGSGKTLVILGFIMRNKFFKKNILKNTFYNNIYNNSLLSSDISNIIADYLVEANSFTLNISSSNIRNNNNLFKSKYYEMIDLNNQPKTIIKTNLIIVPHNLFEQWKIEIEKTYLTSFFIKDKKNLVNIKENIINNNYNIILCNVNKLVQLLDQLPNEQYNFERVFIDEADVINLPHFPELNSNFLWLITTTYKRILNPKNNGFINNLFHSNFSNSTIFYKNLLEKLTFSFNKDYITQKINLSIPNKNLIIVSNNFINSLFYSLEKTTYYKFLNSYDYESLYYYILRSKNNGILYYCLSQFLFSTIENISSDDRDMIDNVIQTLDFNFENKSSILFLYLIRCINYINNDLINRKLMQRISFINTSMKNIKTHVLNCPQCCINYGCDNIKSFSDFDLFNKDINDLNIFLNKNKNNNSYKKCSMNIEQLKYKIYSIQTNFKKIKSEIENINFIKTQLVRNGFCLRCMTIHNNDHNCSDGIFFNLFNIANIDFTIFDTFLLNINDLYKYKYIREIVYDDPIIIDDINDVCDQNINYKLDQMIISLKKDIKDKKRCLIFSDNNFFFKNIIVELNNNNISNRTLKGNTNTINSIIRRYKNYDINVLLLNMKHSGSGINLEMSDNIYIMNYLDADMETQVIGRVNRIGKKNDLNINYYLTTHEYDFYKKIISSDTKSNIIIENI